jgi:hypothetical protein
VRNGNGARTSPTSRAERSSRSRAASGLQAVTTAHRGFAADAKKYLEAALAGWRVLRLTELQITAPMIERIIAFIRTAGVKSV